MTDADRLDAPESSWWAKYNHAGAHLRSLRQACDDYAARNPVEARREPTETPGEIEYRFRQWEEVPVRISLILGDVLHNLRSALDSLVVGLVTEDIGRQMKPKEERHCQFPICGHPNEFDAFFTGTKEKPNEERNALISHRVRESLRAAQPFYGLEMDKALGGDSERRLSYEDYARFHPLTVVSQLSNIDKHRRVTVAAWWPRIAFFTNDEDSKYEWKPLKWPPFEDGQIIVRMTGTGPEPSKVVHEFALVLPDSPNHPPVDYFASNYLPQEPEYWRLTVGGAMSTAIGQYRRLGQQEGQQTEPSTL